MHFRRGTKSPKPIVGTGDISRYCCRHLDEYFMMRGHAYQSGATQFSEEYEEVVSSRTQLKIIYDLTIFLMRNIS